MNQNSNMYEILGKLNSISAPEPVAKQPARSQLQESAVQQQSQSPYDRLTEKYQRYVDNIAMKEGVTAKGEIKKTATGQEYTAAPGHRVRATIGPGPGEPKVDFVKAEPSKDSQAAQPSDSKEKPVDESGLQAYLGKKKYGQEGMRALQQAGREGASKEKMAKIRARHDKMDEADMEEGNKFAYNVIKAKAAGKKQADLDGDGDMEQVREASKPDYLDFDKDGNKKEPMKKALKDKKAHAVEEGWDDMVKDVERRRTSPKVGGRYQGHKGEIERTATGVRHTRRYDPETGETGGDDAPEQKRGRGRPKSSAGPRQERVTAKSRKTDRTAHGQSGFKAGSKRSKEVEEAMETLRRCGYNVDKLEEKAVSTAQQKFMGMAHAMQKGKKIPGASPELKKVAKTMKKGDVEDFAKTKHKGLPQHVKPKKKTEEGSVEGGKRPGDLTGTWSASAPAKGKPNVPPPVPKDPVSPAKKPKSNTKKADAGGDQAVAETETTSGKGGMSFGKGIYDSLNRAIEGMIAETAQLNESISINTSISSEGNRNITINATDEDADKLAHILKLAGLSSEEKHDDVCPGCGSSQCGCDHLDEADIEVSDNNPDYPANMAQEDDTEFMTQTISGGLNKPKRDQTTLPHIAVKSVQSEGIERSLWNLYKKV